MKKFDGVILAETFGLKQVPLRGRRSLPRFFAVDFFCGAGGTTRGLIDAGGYVLCGVDKDSLPAQTYIENNRNEKLDRKYPEFLALDIFPRSTCYPSGRQNELIAALADRIDSLKARYPSVPWLFAVCAPCQPFTTLSRKKLSEKRDQARLRDARLLEEALNLVKHFEPDVVLSENVAGIRATKYGNVWHSFEQGLLFSDYKTTSNIICASKFGVPQRRRRSVLIAIHAKLMGKRPIGELPEFDANCPPASVREALKGLPFLKAGEQNSLVPNHRAARLTTLNLRRLQLSLPGTQNSSFADAPEGDLRLECHKRTKAKFQKICFGDAYGRMKADGPSPTITTKCYSITNGRFGHPIQDRAISMREAAALQSFSRDYTFYPTHQIVPVARMIGNAVPPKLARFFADYAVSLIESQK